MDNFQKFDSSKLKKGNFRVNYPCFTKSDKKSVIIVDVIGKSHWKVAYVNERTGELTEKVEEKKSQMLIKPKHNQPPFHPSVLYPNEILQIPCPSAASLRVTNNNDESNGRRNVPIPHTSVLPSRVVASVDDKNKVWRKMKSNDSHSLILLW